MVILVLLLLLLHANMQQATFTMVAILVTGFFYSAEADRNVISSASQSEDHESYCNSSSEKHECLYQISWL